LDLFAESATVLAFAATGASHTRMMAVCRHMRQDETRMLLKMLIDRNLLELDSSAVYWTTVEGTKFLELQFHMERILQAQKSLV